jgi:hypothetical protein
MTKDIHYSPDDERLPTQPRTISGTILTIATFLLPLTLAAMALYLAVLLFV